MKRTPVLLSTAAFVGLILAGCQSGEQGQAAEESDPLEISVSDLRALEPNDIELIPVFSRIERAMDALPTEERVEILSVMVEDAEALYAEENAVYESLWALEVEHGTPNPVDVFARGTSYRFRWFPRWAPGRGAPNGPDGDFDSVEDFREIRATRILRMREALNQFDLVRGGRAVLTDFRVAVQHIGQAERLLERAQAEIEFDQTGVRPPQ